MNILVIRFRQMGDAVMTTVLLNSLRQSFPEAHIDFVLNERIAPLFRHHPSIDQIITFSEEEKHSPLRYLHKVWRVVHQKRYDIIIDKRSTPNTLPFALFSRRTPWRIGQRKSYTGLVFNHLVTPCRQDESMVHHMQQTLRPLEALATIHYSNRLSLGIQPEEISSFRQYMQEQGIDFARPVALVAVTSKLADKTWPTQNMAELVALVMKHFPQLQLIFNYAPGQEELTARDICQQLGDPSSIFINLQARSARQLAAMAANITLYFGNEGGARHIVHAMEKPSFSICSPSAPKAVWIPTDTDVPTDAIAPIDFATREQLSGMTAEQQYDLLTTDRVWQRLQPFIAERLSALDATTNTNEPSSFISQPSSFIPHPSSTNNGTHENHTR